MLDELRFLSDMDYRAHLMYTHPKQLGLPHGMLLPGFMLGDAVKSNFVEWDNNAACWIERAGIPAGRTPTEFLTLGPKGIAGLRGPAEKLTRMY